LNYLSLNRRWRPKAFDEVTGQEHVTRTLKNAITQGRVAHAYLFAGRRGTGKTTMARLLAMCLNCRSHPSSTPDPCGECESCRGIISGSSADVIELDAASNRGIDEIRALQENVHLAPMSGRRKVYIIDEAHQMTKDAYNAFLKTLEEPPEHVIFVLATTEPEKILPTVRSRCQRFEFRPIPEPDLAARLRTVAEAESIDASDELLDLVARKAEGSVRDALGLLEQCVAFAGDSPTVEDFLSVTGGVDLDSLRRLSALTREGQAAEAVALLDEMIRSGRDPGAVCAGLVDYLRDVFLTSLRREGAAGRPSSASVRVGADKALDAPLLAEDAAAWEAGQLLVFIDKLAGANAEMRYSPQPRLVLEMALLSLSLKPTRPAAGPAKTTADTGAAGDGEETKEALPAQEKTAPFGASEKPAPAPSGASEKPAPAPSGASEKPTPAPSGASEKPAPAPAEAAEKTAPVAEKSAPDETAQKTAPVAGGQSGPGRTAEWFGQNWDAVLEAVRKKSVFVKAFLLKAVPVSLEGDILTLAFAAKFHKEQMEERKNRQLVEEALSEFAGGNIRIKCRLDETVRSRSGGGTVRPGSSDETVRSGSGGGTVRSGAAEPSTETPRRAEARPAAGSGGGSPELQRAPRSPEPDSDAVRSALSIFGGRVVEDGPESDGAQ